MATTAPVAGARATRAGLRERKKQATREALGVAALELALERGLGSVRVSDIAERAGVSPRTYNNYFSSREEAVCALGADRARRTVNALRARPPGEALAQALTSAISAGYGPNEPDKAMLRLLVCDPAVRGEYLKATSGVHHQLAEAIAERTGIGTGIDLLPSVLAGAYQGAARAAILYWLRDECPRPLAAVLREALTALAPVASALQPPGPTSARRRTGPVRKYRK
ncbi:MAG: TetR/AcrR family transcriptional regulator [Acidimicrobiales bacterium]